MLSKMKSSSRATQSAYNTRMSTAQSSSREVKRKPEKDGTVVKELSLPNVEPIDKEKHLPFYSSILSGANHDCIGIEDLDRLQQELELLLTSSLVRTKELKAGVQLLNTTEESSGPIIQLQLAKQEKHKKGGSWAGSQSETNDKSQSDEDWSDGENESDNDDEESGGKVDRTSRRGILPITPPPVAPISKNDVPSNYWAFVDSYFPEIVQEDIEFLEEMLNSYDRLEEEGNLEIPELGAHFSQLEIKHQDKENSLENSLETPQNDPAKAAKANMPGPLMQLVTCALVEPAIPPNSRRRKTKNAGSGTSVNRRRADLSRNVPKQSDDGLLSLPSSHDFTSMEEGLFSRVKKLKWLDDEATHDPDEILTDLKKCKTEISSLIGTNKKWLDLLKDKCIEQMSRENVNKRIEEINNEIINICRQNVTLNNRKKNLCWKLLEERHQLVKILQDM